MAVAISFINQRSKPVFCSKAICKKGLTPDAPAYSNHRHACRTKFASRTLSMAKTKTITKFSVTLLFLLMDEGIKMPNKSLPRW